MKGYNYWSYAPYRPLLTEVGDIYICRVVPSETEIHLEWLDANQSEYTVYCRNRDKNAFFFSVAGTTTSNEFDIKNLETDTNYEFFVKSGSLKSRTRLARCGKSIGTVVNYLHPEDKAYSFSGSALCSPSIVRHPDGYLLASMDLFEADAPQNLTLIFRSDDDGKSWHYVSELMPCFWGKMFIHKGELYMLSCSTEYGDLLIGKSTDGGKTFSAPVCLLRGSGGKKGHAGIHKNPQNIVFFNGRIYQSLEWGTWANKEYCHAAMVMSIDENADLLDPENWHFSEPKVFNPDDAPEISHLPKCNMTIEGTLAVSPEGKLLNIMRFGNHDSLAICYQVNTSDPDAPLTYSHCIKFPAHRVKFMIKYDEASKKYYTICNYMFEPHISNRNVLSLMASEDLKNWKLVKHLYDFRDEDPDKIGLQYVDYEIEGKDIIYLCRTAMNDARNFHDANYSTFHRIKDFRKIKY